MRGPQFTTVGVIVVLFTIALALTIWVNGDFGWAAAVIAIFVIVAVVDFFQVRHSVRRNYPLFGRLRWVGEQFRPEIQQYFVEPDTEGQPTPGRNGTRRSQSARSVVLDKENRPHNHS